MDFVSFTHHFYLFTLHFLFKLLKNSYPPLKIIFLKAKLPFSVKSYPQTSPLSQPNFVYPPVLALYQPLWEFTLQFSLFTHHFLFKLLKNSYPPLKITFLKAELPFSVKSYPQTSPLSQPNFVYPLVLALYPPLREFTLQLSPFTHHFYLFTLHFLFKLLKNRYPPLKISFLKAELPFSVKSYPQTSPLSQPNFVYPPVLSLYPPLWEFTLQFSPFTLHFYLFTLHFLFKLLKNSYPPLKISFLKAELPFSVKSYPQISPLSQPNFVYPPVLALYPPP
ncbi:hypothetical protein [Bacillus salipaludis]|uniref:hypothetical protein n=1 Tax=Bacillus salipaludis TaxID=2547811 RepID=UPI002E207B21|nr:hypothetical protein [Bacillus salipaludis]